MRLKRGKTEETEFKEERSLDENEEDDFLGELDLDEE